MTSSDTPITHGAHRGAIAARRILDLAIERELLRHQDVARIAADIEREHGGSAPAELILDRMVGDALLDPQALFELAREASSASPSPPLSPPPPAVATIAIDWDTGFPVTGWDRYEFVELIGTGGMGHVYKARDPRLDRHVALKFLRRDDPQVLQRFTREARVQSRIDHENVCPVFEVGEVEGHPFIAMQYVAGGSLKEVGDQLSLDEKMAIMIDVADALHAAHRKGLIHRDIKPGNILIERAEDGGWRPFVVDFGIARPIGEHDLTVTGMVVGTPAFAAPEQVRGESDRLDGRTDIYGLGATLYWLITGQSPYEGNLPEILSGHATNEPTPPHRLNREIPVDLETVTLKCLERNPEQRYTTAREVSEDLRRVLAGDPIVARPPSLAFRAAKLLKRHRAIAATVAVAIAALIVLAGLNVRAGWLARQRTGLVQGLVEKVGEIEAVIRVTSMMPRHDRRQEWDLITARLQEIEGEVRRLGELGIGPGQYALGRCYLILQNYATARTHLEHAIAAGFDTPDVSYALGRAIGKLYERELETARGMDDDRLRAAFREKIELELKVPALRHLRRSANLPNDAPSYLEGLIAFYDGRLDDALDKASEAFAQLPWLYEAKALEGDIHVAAASNKMAHGDHQGSLADLERAGVAYRIASDLARSDAGVYENDCGRWIQEMDVLIRLGAPAERAYTEALAACGRALEVDPNRGHVYERSSLVHWRWADHQNDSGSDPRPFLDQSVESAERAIELNPGSSKAHHNIGGALTVGALYEMGQGIDPRPSLDRAAASFRQAIALEPTSVTAHDDLGYALERRARYEMDAGLDPTASLDAAIASFRRAIELNPSYANAHNNMGIALWRLGAYKRRRGRDPSPTLGRALEAYDRAISLNPNYAYAHANRGLACRTLGLYRFALGEDPTSWLTRARADIDAALAINPRIYWAYVENVAVEVLAARWDMRHNQPPDDHFFAALTAAGDALELNPQSATAYQTAAEVHRWRATWLIGREARADQEVAEGLGQTDAALRINSNHAGAMLTRGALLLLQAEASSPGRRRATLIADSRRWIARSVEGNRLLEPEARELLERAERLEVSSEW